MHTRVTGGSSLYTQAPNHPHTVHSPHAPTLLGSNAPPGRCLSPKQAEELGDRLHARAEAKKMHLEHVSQQVIKQEASFMPTFFTSPKHREYVTHRL